MKCVICEERDADKTYNYTWEGCEESVTCASCRMSSFPDHMNKKQYKRYWDVYNIKYRKEQKCLKS